jgi:hypothetical protein
MSVKTRSFHAGFVRVLTSAVSFDHTLAEARVSLSNAMTPRAFAIKSARRPRSAEPGQPSRLTFRDRIPSITLVFSGFWPQLNCLTTRHTTKLGPPRRFGAHSATNRHRRDCPAKPRDSLRPKARHPIAGSTLVTSGFSRRPSSVTTRDQLNTSITAETVVAADNRCLRSSRSRPSHMVS